MLPHVLMYHFQFSLFVQLYLYMRMCISNVTYPIREVGGADVLHRAGEDASRSPLYAHSTTDPKVIAHHAQNCIQSYKHSILVLAFEVTNTLHKQHMCVNTTKIERR